MRLFSFEQGELENKVFSTVFWVRKILLATNNSNQNIISAKFLEQFSQNQILLLQCWLLFDQHRPDFPISSKNTFRFPRKPYVQLVPFKCCQKRSSLTAAQIRRIQNLEDSVLDKVKLFQG